jgi:hypothetical protein
MALTTLAASDTQVLTGSAAPTAGIVTDPALAHVYYQVTGAGAASTVTVYYWDTVAKPNGLPSRQILLGQIGRKGSFAAGKVRTTQSTTLRRMLKLH